MDEEFRRERAMTVRAIAEKADPFTKKRLLASGIFCARITLCRRRLRAPRCRNAAAVAVVFFQAVGSESVAVAAGLVSLLALLGFWLGYPFWRRSTSRAATTQK